MNRPIDSNQQPAGPMDPAAFDEYLRGNSPISRQYRSLPDDEVPPHLDALVLAQARDALAQQSPPVADDDLARVRSKRRRLTQWAIPTALAACSLVVVSIVIRSGTQHQVSAADPVKAELPAAAPPSQAAARPEQSSAAEDTQGLVLIAPPRDAVTEFSSLAPAPAAGNARVDSERRILERATAQRREREQRRSVAMPTFDEPTLPKESPAAEASPPAPAVAAALPGEQKQAVAQERRSDEMRPEEEALDEIAVTGMRAQQGAHGGPRGTIGASAGMSAQQWETEQMHADPDRWLEHIRELRRDSRPVLADREWQAFRKRYPDYVVATTDLARGRQP